MAGLAIGFTGSTVGLAVSAAGFAGMGPLPGLLGLLPSSSGLLPGLLGGVGWGGQGFAIKQVHIRLAGLAKGGFSRFALAWFTGLPRSVKVSEFRSQGEVASKRSDTKEGLGKVFQKNFPAKHSGG